MLSKPAFLSTAAAQLCFFIYFQSILSPLQAQSHHCQWSGVKFASCRQRRGSDAPSPALHCGCSWGTKDGHQACAKSPAPQGPAALRCHLEKYKSFSIGKGKEFSAILLPPDRETDLLINTIPAPVKPNLLWKSPKNHFPGDAGNSSTKQEWHWSGPQLAVLPFGRFSTKAPCRSTFPTWVVPRHSDFSAPRLQTQTSLHGQSGR